MSPARPSSSTAGTTISPDCFITLDVAAETVLEKFPNYLAWETGKFPNFVLDVASSV